MQLACRGWGHCRGHRGNPSWLPTEEAAAPATNHTNPSPQLLLIISPFAPPACTQHHPEAQLLRPHRRHPDGEGGAPRGPALFTAQIFSIEKAAGTNAAIEMLLKTIDYGISMVRGRSAGWGRGGVGWVRVLQSTLGVTIFSTSHTTLYPSSTNTLFRRHCRIHTLMLHSSPPGAATSLDPTPFKLIHLYSPVLLAPIRSPTRRPSPPGGASR